MLRTTVCAVTLALCILPGCKEDAAKPAGNNAAVSDDKASAPSPENATFTGLDAVRPVFPKDLAGYALDGVKEKKKSAKWTEYSATYKGAAGKVKLVINEHAGGPNPEWEQLFGTLETKKKFSGHQGAHQKKEDKETWMVIVAPRFRVDVKSRDLGGDDLERLADAFPYAAVAKLGK